MVPGTEQHRRISAALPELSRRMRTAFAAGCAERVMPLLEYHYGDPKECREALEGAWTFASGGEISGAELQQRWEACDALVDELYEADERGYVMRAVYAVCCALESAMAVGSEVAERAIEEAADAAAAGDVDDGDAGIQEEAEWQELALDVAMTAQQPSRDMFRHLPSTPAWLRRFRQRQP